jgi:hypothetical protein
MVTAYLPDQIEVKSAGIVKNIYSKSEEINNTVEVMQNYKHSMENLVKKEIPLFCIMLKIN